jgi:hypothetical protein
MVRRLDHLVVALDDARAAHEFCADALGLPAAWPFQDYGSFASGGIGFGNLNLELCQSGVQFPASQPARVRGLAFEPAESVDERLAQGLDEREIARTQPSPTPGWTNMGLPSFVPSYSRSSASTTSPVPGTPRFVPKRSALLTVGCSRSKGRDASRLVPATTPERSARGADCLTRDLQPNLDAGGFPTDQTFVSSRVRMTKSWISSLRRRTKARRLHSTMPEVPSTRSAGCPSPSRSSGRSNERTGNELHAGVAAVVGLMDSEFDLPHDDRRSTGVPQTSRARARDDRRVGSDATLLVAWPMSADRQPLQPRRALSGWRHKQAPLNSPSSQAHTSCARVGRLP